MNFPRLKILSALAVSLATFGAIPAGVAASAVQDIYPVPHSVRMARAMPLSASELSPESVAAYPVLAEALRSRGLVAKGSLSVVARTGKEAENALRELGVPAVSGAYVLVVSGGEIEIDAFDDTGVFYATQTLAQMIEARGNIPLCTIGDYPDVPFRGAVEGFYGKPWEHERRLSQIRFYGKYKMNAYVYGPKDDPHSGFGSPLWREPYPEKEAAQIAELARAARENHVEFFWALHPGTSIHWADADGDGVPDDFRVALAKFESLYALGVRAFAVFFDDISGEGTNAEKQAEMLNFLNREFVKKKRDVAPLLLCPTEYTGSRTSRYKKTLGERLDKDVNIMWTGEEVCSEIPAASSAKIAESWQRKPFIWWNWPVSDYCRTNLLLGRVYGLDKGNKGLLAGFVSNPMDKPEASKIGIFSVADWAWNTDAFDSEKSWKAAFPRLFPSCADAMAVFAEHNSDQGLSTHRFRREESARFKPTADAALAQYRVQGGLDDDAGKALSAEFLAVYKAAGTLKQRLPENDPALWHEIEFWVDSFAQLGLAGTAATHLATNGSLNLSGRLQLFSAIATAKAIQQENFEAQKKRHREETFPSDKRWATGCRVGTCVLTPLVDEIFGTEWKKTCDALNEKIEDSRAVFKAFSSAGTLRNLQAEHDGIYVSLQRIYETVKLAPGEFVGLALPEGVPATRLHIELDNPQALAACDVEVSREGENWENFTADVNGQSLARTLDPKENFRFFRLKNASAEEVAFRIHSFKIDIPAEAKHSAEEAVFDRDPETFLRVETPKKFVGPANARPLVMSDAAEPATAIRVDGNAVEIVPQNGVPVRVFEIFWK